MADSWFGFLGCLDSVIKKKFVFTSPSSIAKYDTLVEDEWVMLHFFQLMF